MYEEILTEREIEVMELVKKGLHNYEIAERLSITKFTVKKHLESIYPKMGVYNRVQASVKYALGKYNIVENL